MLSPGTKLGHYEIEDSVGAGGMGEVYRARDVRLDRTVAIKVLPSHLSENEDLRTRFDREAKTISQLQHPNICALHDVGHENGIDFLVMEYLEGETLAERLGQGPIDNTELISFAMQIAGALDAAHRNGVVHRDLKPGNVILTRAGAKLLDFGLAKIAVAGDATESSQFTQLATGTVQTGPLTEQGTVLGTFQYMSPEQLEGKEADARSDIFAFGALLYEMSTGQRAFSGDSQASLIASIMTTQPAPIASIQPMIPPALDRIIRTALEKDPDNRWQTVHDMVLQLKWIQEGGSELGVPRPVAARRRGKARTAWIVASIASVAAVVFATLYFTRPQPPAPQAFRFSIEAPEEVVSFGSPRISPDGRMIAFNGTSVEGDHIWIRPLNSNEAYPLPGTEGASRPFWSPDSKNIGFFAGSKLKRVPVSGGPPLTLCEFDRGSDGAWGKDFILFDGQIGDSILAVPAGGGEIRPASAIEHSKGEGSGDGWPFFLPDGEQFVFIRFLAAANEVHLGRIGSMETKMLTLGESRLEYVYPGYLIYERSNTLLAHPFDPDRGELTGEPFALTEGIGTGASGLAHFSCSENGVLIYTQGEDIERNILHLDRNGRELATLGEPGLYETPALSPDGRKLALEIFDESAGTSDIWVLDLDRNVRSRFTFEGSNTHPLWSPDGSEILFRTTQDGKRRIHRKKVSGAGQREVVMEREGFLTPGNLSSAGYFVFAGAHPEMSVDVCLISLSDPDTTRYLVSGPGLQAQPQLSPDSRYVAYVSNETGRWEVYLRSLDAEGGKWQVTSNGGSEPQWRGDGKELYYIATDRSLMAVTVEDGATPRLGMPLKLFDAPVQRDLNTRNRFVPAADGRSFYCLALMESDRVPPTNVILNWTAELEQR